MKILIVGKGAREHCMAWKCRQDPRVTEVFVASGNAGMRQVATTIDIHEADMQGLLQFALKEKIDLTIAGTETPLELGLADLFNQHGLPIFAPSQAAAKIETSKDFAKQLMQRAGIPTAQYATFTDYEEAKNYVEQKGAPIVIKNDGLAAGKGVVVALSMEEAMHALKDFLLHEKYGMKRVVIEEFLEGEEFTLMCMAHGENYMALPLSQDHKRAYDDDKGPNTGGMGAYSPVPQINCLEESIHRVIQPVLSQLKKEDNPFCGFLYAGLMQTQEGVKVIEFNARFGDPECEVLLPLLGMDWLDKIWQLMSDKPMQIVTEYTGSHALGVVIASVGYPEKPMTGFPIHFPVADDVLVFHAGTVEKEGNFISAGGRVAVVVSVKDRLMEAQTAVYQYIRQMSLSEHFFFRQDIGAKAISFINRMN